MRRVAQTIQYATPSGKIVTIEHVTQQTDIGDHNYSVATDDIQVSIGGKYLYGADSIVDHPQFGRVIKGCGNEYCYIAPEALEEVNVLYAAYNQRHTAKIQSLVVTPGPRGNGWCDQCESYCYGDCHA